MVLITVCFALNTCTQPPTLLEKVQNLGELRVATRVSSSTYYQGSDGPVGLEFDLAREFADYLGVNLVMYAPENFTDVISDVTSEKAHMAAAGLSITGPREALLKFGPSYMETTPQLVYRYGQGRPKSLDDIKPNELTIVASSSHEEQLRSLKLHHPELEWQTVSETDSEELIYRVHKGDLKYTVADSTDVLLNRYFYPNIRPAFDLKAPEPIAWAFRRDEDDTLLNASFDFFAGYTADESLADLKERHFGHTNRFDFVGSRLFLRHTNSRLPRYQEDFETAAETYGVPWQLLASIGYQESHWNAKAVSPTGVRGIMMLTQGTARQMGVSNRTDPTQSIMGGARYFNRVKSKIPERIGEPDRTWLALAAYNVGFGHLEDARILTEMHNKDPDRWIDVREYLPLLSQKKWYSQLRRGYARGWEPVLYVDNIRSYYETLLWQTSSRNYGAQEAEKPDETEEDADEDEREESSDTVDT
ncbi:MAG: membrane-bound lytic murein transglycosylase MltF [Pseudomonadota bacterium]